MIGAIPQWLLLDVPSATQASATLQQVFSQAQRFWLFEGTELQALREDGPVLIDLRTCPALAELCYSDTQVLRGLLIVSEVSSSRLLALPRALVASIRCHW